MTTKKLDLIASEFGLPTSRDVSEISPHTFPTFAELVQEEEKRQTQMTAPRDNGLFQQLMSGDIRHFYHDMEKFPDKYTEDDRALIQRLLASGNTQPTIEEREKLNTLVNTYFEKPKAAPVKRQPSNTTPRSVSNYDSYEPREIPSSIFPNNVPKPFWWI
jgi:hypothetical protein